MSEPAQLAQSAREKLAAALNALQTNAHVPEELMGIAEPIAGAMSVLHRIERTHGADLAGRDDALNCVRSALDMLQSINVAHPAVEVVMESVASSLSKVHQLAKFQPPAAAPQPPAAAPQPPAAAPQPAPAPPKPAPQPPQPGPMPVAPVVPRPSPSASPQPLAASGVQAKVGPAPGSSGPNQTVMIPHDQPGPQVGAQPHFPPPQVDHRPAPQPVPQVVPQPVPAPPANVAPLVQAPGGPQPGDPLGGTQVLPESPLASATGPMPHPAPGAAAPMGPTAGGYPGHAGPGAGAPMGPAGHGYPGPGAGAPMGPPAGMGAPGAMGAPSPGAGGPLGAQAPAFAGMAGVAPQGAPGFGPSGAYGPGYPGGPAPGPGPGVPPGYAPQGGYQAHAGQAHAGQAHPGQAHAGQAHPGQAHPGQGHPFPGAQPPQPQGSPQGPGPQGVQAPPTAPAGGQAGNVVVELGAHSGSNFYKGLGGNDVIEHGGIFVATYKIPAIGANVNLRVLLPGDYEFQASAVVQWSRESASGDGAEPGFGARFLQITPEGRQLVYRYTRNREPIFYDDL